MRSRNHCDRGKATGITYSVCVCVSVSVSAALVIQHAERMRRNILLPVACQAPPGFSTSPHTRYDFRIKVTEHKMCHFCLRLSSETFLILRRIQRDL